VPLVETDAAWPDLDLSPLPSAAWYEGWRNRLGARRVSNGPPAALRRPSDHPLAGGLPIAIQGSVGGLSPFRANWGNLLIGPAQFGSGGSGGSGTVTFTPGTGIAITPSGTPTDVVTIAHALTGGTNIGITGAVIDCLIAAGSNLSFSGSTLDAADQYPTDGYGIRVDGAREVNLDARMMACVLLLNATWNGSSFTTGVAPFDAGNGKFVYKAVPIRFTALGGTTSISQTYVVDDDEPFAEAVWSPGSETYVEVYNTPTHGNTTTYRYPGLNAGASGYPPDFAMRGLGEEFDEGGGASTWHSFPIPAFRYRISGSSYRWILGGSPMDDGTCPA